FGRKTTAGYKSLPVSPATVVGCTGHVHKMLPTHFQRSVITRATETEDFIIRVPHHIAAQSTYGFHHFRICLAINRIFSEKDIESLTCFHIDGIAREPPHADSIPVRIRQTIPV